jgi:hypothetical protein
MKRTEVLEEANRLICEDRAKQYGDAKDNFKRIAMMWSAYLGYEIDEADVAVMMTLLKCSRLAHQRKDDSYVDGAAYMALASELSGD